MAEKPSDFTLPEKIVSKILKDALPDNVAVSKDAKSAAARGAAMFILNLVISANSQAEDTKRDTISCQDILDALSYVGLEEYAPQLLRYSRKKKKEK